MSVSEKLWERHSYEDHVSGDQVMNKEQFLAALAEAAQQQAINNQKDWEDWAVHLAQLLKCPPQTVAMREAIIALQQQAIEAKAEGRREGLRQAARYVENQRAGRALISHEAFLQAIADEIRLLASQTPSPKLENK